MDRGKENFVNRFDLGILGGLGVAPISVFSPSFWWHCGNIPLVLVELNSKYTANSPRVWGFFTPLSLLYTKGISTGMAVNGGPDSGPKGAVTEDEYGVLKKPNIANVVFGDLEIQPWYGNAAYFDTKYSHHELGIEVANGVKQKKDTTRGSTTRKTPPPGFGSEIDPENLGIWLDRLFVCEYCFKYTIDEDKFEIHRVACKQNKSLPMVGKLVYRDDVSPYVLYDRLEDTWNHSFVRTFVFLESCFSMTNRYIIMSTSLIFMCFMGLIPMICLKIVTKNLILNLWGFSQKSFYLGMVTTT